MGKIGSMRVKTGGGGIVEVPIVDKIKKEVKSIKVQTSNGPGFIGLDKIGSPDAKFPYLRVQTDQGIHTIGRAQFTQLLDSFEDGSMSEYSIRSDRGDTAKPTTKHFNGRPPTDGKYQLLIRHGNNHDTSAKAGPMVWTHNLGPNRSLPERGNNYSIDLIFHYEEKSSHSALVLFGFAGQNNSSSTSTLESISIKHPIFNWTDPFKFRHLESGYYVGIYKSHRDKSITPKNFILAKRRLNGSWNFIKGRHDFIRDRFWRFKLRWRLNDIILEIFDLGRNNKNKDNPVLVKQASLIDSEFDSGGISYTLTARRRGRFSGWYPPKKTWAGVENLRLTD